MVREGFRTFSNYNKQERVFSSEEGRSSEKNNRRLKEDKAQQ